MRGIYRIAFAAMAFLAAGQALAAGTAANTQLENTVTVNFDNLAGDPQTAVTDMVTVTINLLQAAPTLATNSTTPADTSDNISEGQIVSIFYQVSSNANGPDQYEIDFSEALTTLDPSEITEGLLPQTRDIGWLGASTVGADATWDNTDSSEGDCIAPATGVCTIEVPNDTTGVGGVNEIQAADTVIVEGTDTLYCTVNSITDNENAVYTPGVSFSEIVVDDCFADLSGTPLGFGSSVSIGDSIYETAEFQVDFTIGDITTGSTGQTIVSATADTQTNSNPSGTEQQTINVEAPTIVVYKYVRNVDTDEVGTVAAPYDAMTYNSETYYRDGVTAEPGQQLEYAILVENQGGGVQDVVITDPTVAFTTYDAGTISLIDIADVVDCGTNTCAVTVNGGGSFAAVADDGLSTGGDFGGVTGGGVVTIYAGVGGDENPASGGTIDAGGYTVGFYTVTVD